MLPLVSICIPTYNRSDCLEQTLQSTICQAEFLDGRVEIVISDNASTDETENVGELYSKKYSGIHYYRNNQNVADKNFPIALSRANGKLRKLNNDTAVLDPDALSYLCEMEQNYETKRPLLFFSNGFITDCNEAYVNDQILDFSSFMKTVSYWITWIASFSLWDTDCENIATDFNDCELRLWQVKKICEIGSAKDSVVICNQHIINSIAPPKKDIGYGLYHVFYENYFKIIDPYVKNGNLSQETRDYLEKDLLFNFFTDWIIKWEMSNKDFQYSETENLKKLVFNQYKDKPYWHGFQEIYNKRLFKCKTKSFLNKILRRG